jgi:hypothetical protein
VEGRRDGNGSGRDIGSRTGAVGSARMRGFDMTTDTDIARTPPVGLGGWLWPVTWVSATLPVFFTASVAPSLPSFIGYLRQSTSSPYSVDTSWAWRAIGLNLLLSLVAWWWAAGWFSRDLRMLRRGPLILFALGILCAVLATIDRHRTMYPMLAGGILGLAMASTLCVRWSKRVHNTFASDAVPLHASPFDAVVFGGPGDWSCGRWLLPGALLYSAFGLCLEWSIFSDVASRTLPPPHPADPLGDGCGLGLIVIGSGHSIREIEAHREALAMSLSAGLLLLGAFTGLARGARWTSWITIAALAMAMAAPLHITQGSWCSLIADGPHFREMWWEWCVVLLLVLIGTGFRRWPARLRMRPSAP